jgi:hypothetical protein
LEHTDMNEQQQIARSAERFTRETAKHEMTIVHDDGLFRHLRFKNPASSAYWFELTTVPGALVFRGDGDTFTFARLVMFQFFRSERGSVNPRYWAEKITDGRDRARVYDEDMFRQVVLEHFHENLVDGGIPLEYAGSALTELCADVLDDETVADETTARAALDRFEFDISADSRTRFADTYEWEFYVWDWWYLWACQAIVWGIKQYDAAKACPECKGERGTHNTTVIASTDGGTVRKCSLAPKPETTEADPRVQAAKRALASARPYVPPAAATDADLAERKMRFAEPNG